jgi:UPF0716 protein FxsA
MPLVFAFFIVMPILELVVLIKVGSYIGVLPTITIVFVTAILGVSLLRSEGISTIRKAQQRLEAGEIPATELVEGALLVVSGAFLLTPGFITDSFGFACLVPPLRQRFAGYLTRRMSLRVIDPGAMFGANEQSHDQEFRSGFGSPRADGEVIEGEVIDSEIIEGELLRENRGDGSTRKHD